MFLRWGRGGCGAGRRLEQEKQAGQLEAGFGGADSWLSGENIWLPSPHSPSQTLLFLQTGAANLFTILESALCVGTVKHRV